MGGNVLKWSKENCIMDAIKYKTKTEWQKKSVGAYRSALKNNWMDDCSNHMIKYSKPHNYWTKERCLKEAKKHGNNWYKKSHTSYVIASRNKWI